MSLGIYEAWKLRQAAVPFYILWNCYLLLIY